MRGKKTRHRRTKGPVRRRKGQDGGLSAAVVDLFCGAGGLSHGFYLKGFEIAAGVDTDERCRHAFEHNNDAIFIRRDVSNLSAAEVDALFPPGKRRVLVGCAPCQPFSTYNQKNENPAWQLVSRFGVLIAKVRPDVVSMENVPRLLGFRDGSVFKEFLRKLRRAGYHMAWDVLYAPDYGVTIPRQSRGLSKCEPLKAATRGR